GVPYSKPGGAASLGTDNLGRDVLSRFLWGGRSILGLSLAATAIGLALGVMIGLIAAYARSVLDDVLMRAMDVILAFPSIVLALVAVRSEEHTSELQSRVDLVCRLLLEKKNKQLRVK